MDSNYNLLKKGFLFYASELTNPTDVNTKLKTFYLTFVKTQFREKHRCCLPTLELHSAISRREPFTESEPQSCIRL